MAQPGVYTTGLLVEYHAARADGGFSPGNNADPTGTFKDISGNGNDGTLQTFAYTAASGWAGAGTPTDPYRLVFDGASDRVELADLGACEDKNFTYEAWVMFPVTPAANVYIINETSSATFYPYAGLMVTNAGKARFTMEDAAAAIATQLSANSICDGLVHHLVATCDGATMRLYVDNVAQAAPPAAPGGAVTTNWTTVGCMRYGAAPTRQGYIPSGDCVAVARIYSAALTVPQIAQNYAAGPDWHLTRTNPLYDGGLHLWVDGAWPPEDAGTDIMADAKHLKWDSKTECGFKSLSFDIYDPTPFTAYSADLARGSWVKLVHGAQTLWEGLVTNNPQIGVAGPENVVHVECGGLFDALGYRTDYWRIWLDRDCAQWRAHRRNSKKFSLNNDGQLELMCENDTVLSTGVSAAYVYLLGDGLTPYDASQKIESVIFDAAWNLGAGFTCQFYYADQYYDDWADWETQIGGVDVWKQTHTTSTVGSEYLDLSGVTARAVAFRIWCDSGSTTTADRFLRLTNVDVNGFDVIAGTTYVDDIMTAIADDMLAGVTTDSAEVDPSIDAPVIRPRMSMSEAMQAVADYAEARFDWGFFADRTFRCKPLPASPAASRVWHWRANEAGYGWDVRPNEERAVDGVCVMYGSSGPSLDEPRGSAKDVFRPDAPAAMEHYDTLDYRDSIMAAASASDIGDQYLAYCNTAADAGSGQDGVGWCTRNDFEDFPAAYVVASDYVIEPAYDADPILITGAAYDLEAGTLTITVGDYDVEFAARIVPHLYTTSSGLGHNGTGISNAPRSSLQHVSWSPWLQWVEAGHKGRR